MEQGPVKVRRAFRFELDPNQKARAALAKHVGAARFAYNWGPAWLSYIFLNGAPVGVVDYKWRVESSQLNNIRLPPDCYDEDSLIMILGGLEGEAELMGHESIEIHNINDSPARFYSEALLGKVMLGEGYSLLFTI